MLLICACAPVRPPFPHERAIPAGNALFYPPGTGTIRPLQQAPCFEAAVLMSYMWFCAEIGPRSGRFKKKPFPHLLSILSLAALP